MDQDSDFEDVTIVTSPATPKAPPKTPWHLPVIGIVAGVWSVLGLFDVLATLTHFSPYMDQIPEATRAFIYSLPIWLLVLRGLAVSASLLGSVLLFRKRVLAVRVLAAAAAATLISTVLSFTRPAPDDAQMTAFAVCIVVVAVLLFYYAYNGQKRGYLRSDD